MTPESEIRPMSEAGRLTNVFMDPKAAFADIAERPRPWVPLIIFIVMNIALVACFSQRAGWEHFLRQKLESSPRTQQLSAEQREQAVQMQLKFVPYMAYVGPPIGVPIMFLAVAGAVLLAARIFGSTVSFKQMFSITAYSFLPGVVHFALAILILFLKPPGEFNLENPTGFNLAAYLDPLTTAKWLYSLAGSLDLFAIWSAILLAVGIAAAGKQNTFGKGLTAVLVSWAVFIVLKMGWASIFG